MKNVELTREVVKYAHERGVSVEGELGVLAGVEDHVFSTTSTYTNPLKAIEFFKKTGVDALAIFLWNHAWCIQRKKMSNYEKRSLLPSRNV